MNRTVAAVVGLLVAAAAGRADIAVPPPAGKKFVPLEVTFTTGKAYPDRDFYVLTGYTPKKVEFGPDAPVKVEGRRRNGPFGAVKLAAVPAGAAGKYADEKAFAADLRAGKVPGQAATKQSFSAQTAIDAKDPRAVVVESYTVEKIDETDGIVLRAGKGGSGSAPPPKGGTNAPDDDPRDLVDFCGTRNPGPSASAPWGGAVVAGLAASLAVALAGLWLARRGRP